MELNKKDQMLMEEKNQRMRMETALQVCLSLSFLQKDKDKVDASLGFSLDLNPPVNVVGRLTN